MLRWLWRIGPPVIAVLAIALAPSARADTIQPILPLLGGVTDNLNGTWTYHYDIQLTPNNGLVDGVDLFRSGLVMLDVNGLISSSLVFVAGDVTAAADWLRSEVATGAAGLPNAAYAAVPKTTTLTGKVGGLSPTATGQDSGVVTNVVLEYKGAGLGTSLLQRSLIHMDILSKGSPGGHGVSLSRDTDGGANRPVETFVFDAPNAVPLPAAAWAGMGLMGLVGLKKRRSQQLEA